jgi:hypothetical protein
MKDCFARRGRSLGAFALSPEFSYQLGRSEDVLVAFARRKSALGTRRAQQGLAAFRSALTAFTVALALVVQLIAMPYQQALAGPTLADPDSAAIAADLKAAFGDAASFCAHIDDRGAPAPHGPCNHCDDQCPVCRLVGQAAAFVPPDPPGLPTRLDPASHAIGSATKFGAFFACRSRTNLARAPPLRV